MNKVSPSFTKGLSLISALAFVLLMSSVRSSVPPAVDVAPVPIIALAAAVTLVALIVSSNA